MGGCFFFKWWEGRHSLRSVSWMGEVTPSQRTPALSTAGSCRHCDPHTLCPCAGSWRCHSAGHSSSALAVPCELRPWTEQPPQHVQWAQGLCRVWGLSKGWQSPPRAGQSPWGPQGQRWLRWMGCHGSPARSCICHQGGQIADRQVARYPRAEVASGVSSAADNLGQCGGKKE